MTKWYLASKKADFQGNAEKYGISAVTARILRNRDLIEEDEIRKFLYGTLTDLYSPFLLKDMDKAVTLLKEKIEKGKKIRVIGDYDVDGICSSYILQKGLTSLGATVDVAIPHRMKDGYGINETLIEEAVADGVDTIITCDNGIAAVEPMAYAKSKGITVIITDHHEVPYEEDEAGIRTSILPEAAAIVNPKQSDCTYPFKGICGGVVAYKLMQALFMDSGHKENCLPELLEFAGIATICDVMELRNENRIIVKYALMAIKHTKNCGLHALMEVNTIQTESLSAYHVGFILGPCLNAAGRLDTARRALQLLQCEKTAEAVTLASELKCLNDSRKEMTEKGIQNAITWIEQYAEKEERVLVVYLPDCHESIAGIIAGKLRDKYSRPVFVLTKGEESAKGSARSIDGYHIYEEMSKCKELFLKYGGHSLAAGLSISEAKIDEFRSRINQLCTLQEEDFIEKVLIDVPMPISYATKELARELAILEPFGRGNAKPVFAEKNITFLGGRIFGKNAKVCKFDICTGDGERAELLYFGDREDLDAYIEKKFGIGALKTLYAGQQPAEKTSSIVMDIIYQVSLNEFRGKEQLQFVLQQYQ